MNAKEFLKVEKSLNLTAIAENMWPDNKAAKSYLTRKLSDSGSSRPWTESDEVLASKVLNELAIRIAEIK